MSQAMLRDVIATGYLQVAPEQWSFGNSMLQKAMGEG